MMIYRDEETYHIFENQDGPNEKSEFEFKDSYWDEMESMLDAHDAKKRKRRGAFFWISSSTLIVLAFFGLYQLNAILYPNIEFSDIDQLVAKGNQFRELEPQVNSNQINTIANQLPVSGISDQNSNLDQNTSVNAPSKNPTVLNPIKQNTNFVQNASFDAQELYHSAEMIASNLLSEKARGVQEKIEKLDQMNAIDIAQIDQDQSNHIVLEKRKAKFPLKHSLYANVEAGLANKYQPTKGVSYAITAGLGYELGFHKNLAFQTGVNLQYRDGLSQFFRNETKVYGFHSTRYYQDVSYKGQINVEIPLALKIKLRRSSITAGVGTSFLVGVRSSVEQYIPESSSVERMDNNFGIKEGIRNMDVNLNLNYAYAVTPNIEVSAGVSAGLLDQTSNEFFSNDNKDHNLQFRIGLKYFFFNK